METTDTTTDLSNYGWRKWRKENPVLYNERQNIYAGKYYHENKERIAYNRLGQRAYLSEKKRFLQILVDDLL